MQYIRTGRTWQESMEKGEIDVAIEDIQYRLLYNLMFVHNAYCGKETYLKSPLEVIEKHTVYGFSEDKDASEKMQPFVEVANKLLAILADINEDDTCLKKQSSLKQLDQLETELIIALAQIEIFK